MSRSNTQSSLGKWVPTSNNGTDQPPWRRTDARATEEGYGWQLDDTDATSVISEYSQPKDCCQNCGTQIDHSVRRVFGDNEDVMHECPSCPDMNREGLTEFANTAGTNRRTKSPEQRRHDG